MKHDQEPAILFLKVEAVRIVQSVTGREVVLEESPGDSQANGLAEGAVKEIKGVVHYVGLWSSCMA